MKYNVNKQLTVSSGQKAKDRETETANQEQIFSAEPSTQQRSLHEDTAENHLKFLQTDTGTLERQNTDQ